MPLYEHLETIKEGTARIKAIVRDLYTFTQLDCDDSKIVNIADCLQSTINLVHTRNNKIAEFITDFKDSPLLLCHPAQLNQVFMNLIVNGCESIRASWGENDTGARGKIVVSCEVIAGHILICVKDNGVGISEESKDKLFEPFFTTKSVGKGTGLGLSIAYGIVQQHGGQLTVESAPGEGALFKLILPME